MKGRKKELSVRLPAETPFQLKFRAWGELNPCFFLLISAWFKFVYVCRANLESLEAFRCVLLVLNVLGFSFKGGRRRNRSSEALPGSRRVKRTFLGGWWIARMNSRLVCSR